VTKTVLGEQIAEIERELALRRAVYPKWVQAGKLNQALADRQVACMEGALRTLRWLEKHEIRIKQMLKETQP
jgi:hypothetical protein